MARKVGQIIARGDRRWLIRVYFDRDHGTKKRNYDNRTIHGPMRETQAYLTGKLRERDLGRVSHTAPVLRAVIDNYLKRSGINITPAHDADHVTMGLSLIMSTRGVGLLPAYVQNFLPSSVTSRPLKGDAPTVDLVLGYRKSNQSPVLTKTFAFEIGRVGRSCVK
jgi:DNA-binding transcriptional LysR family regulator